MGSADLQIKQLLEDPRVPDWVKGLALVARDRAPVHASTWMRALASIFEARAEEALKEATKG